MLSSSPFCVMCSMMECHVVVTTIDSRWCEWRDQNSKNSRKNWGLPPSCFYRPKSMVDDPQTPWFLYWTHLRYWWGQPCDMSTIDLQQQSIQGDVSEWVLDIPDFFLSCKNPPSSLYSRFCWDSPSRAFWRTDFFLSCKNPPSLSELRLHCDSPSWSICPPEESEAVAPVKISGRIGAYLHHAFIDLNQWYTIPKCHDFCIGLTWGIDEDSPAIWAR